MRMHSRINHERWSLLLLLEVLAIGFEEELGSGLIGLRVTSGNMGGGRQHQELSDTKNF